MRISHSRWLIAQPLQNRLHQTAELLPVLHCARRVISYCLIKPFEVIISSASGCGVMVKDYGSLFDKDDVYYQKAQTVSQNTCDIAQLNNLYLL
jgi:hypothetical protein